jgi:hypothetical protein
MPLTILGRGNSGFCCKHMYTANQWLNRKNWGEEVLSCGYMSNFAMQWNENAWRTNSKQYLKTNPTKSVNRLEACTLICVMSPTGKMLMVNSGGEDECHDWAKDQKIMCQTMVNDSSSLWPTPQSITCRPCPIRSKIWIKSGKLSN